MRRYSSRHTLHVLTELNVTPLLDLAFVLLIIFMITTPLMENSTEIVLPTGASDLPVDSQAVSRVTLALDGTIMLNGESVTLAQLTERLETVRQTNPDTAVIIRSDKQLAMQEFLRVVDAVKASGLKKIGIASIESTR
jgi:biopolymer transport protein ExbD